MSELTVAQIENVLSYMRQEIQWCDMWMPDEEDQVPQVKSALEKAEELMRCLRKLGVNTPEDIDRLLEKFNELENEITSLNKVLTVAADEAFQRNEGIA